MVKIAKLYTDEERLRINKCPATTLNALSGWAINSSSGNKSSQLKQDYAIKAATPILGCKREVSI